jgi:mono/diheme cytochrome c family protein
MAKNKYLLLGSSLGVLVLLIIAAVQENLLREWRRLQAQMRADEGPIKVQLRQIVNPGLRISDRCVSCHVGMAPGEQSLAGAAVARAHKPVVHDPADYGCTVCHGGQGQATEKADAHGNVHFWPEPMIPARFSYAGCGACHVAIRVPNQPHLALARVAFERLDCLACHPLDGRGGLLRPGGGGMEGPDLSRAGISGYDADWYAKHLRKSAAVSGGPWKTSFAPISESDRELLAVFLATRMAAAPLIEAKAAFHSHGCLGCHKVSGVGGDEGPDLSRAGEKDPGQLDFAEVPGKPTLENWLAEHFRAPGALVPGSQMPPVKAAEEDIRLLTMYVLSLRRRDLPGTFLPKDRLRVTRLGEREFQPEGATIFGAFCVGCHGTEGQGKRAPGMQPFPAIANPDFLSLAPDDFLAQTIRKGRPGRRMPAWGEKDGGLRPSEVAQVVSYLRRMGGVEVRPESTPPRWITAEAAPGKRLFAAACSGCHGARGEGGEGPALNNKVLLSAATDTYLVQTIARGRRGTAMEGFLNPSPARRTLSAAEIESVVAFIRLWSAGVPPAPGPPATP